MLAIKECLMREGVFKDSNDWKYELKYDGSRTDLLPTQKSQDTKLSENLTSSSNLSSTAVTAKTSCPQSSHLQHQKQQPVKTKINSSSERYQGYHPHFRNHTTPAYYTDIHLRIHTPDVADVASLNENYRSVYNTPSNLLEGEHHFPKTSTATVAPPPIGTANGKNNGNGNGYNRTFKPFDQQQQRAAFFRGASAVNGQQRRKSLEPYTRSSPTSTCPTKGDFNTFTQSLNPDGRVVFACVNLKQPTVDHPAIVADSSLHCAIINDREPLATPSPRHSRNSQRFNQRSNGKRVVRVRSESRPLSALYDIICKEKGLDTGTLTTTTTTTTTTSDEEENSRGTNSFDKSSRHDDDVDRRSKDKDARRKTRKKHSKLRTMSLNRFESPPSLMRPTSATGTDCSASSNNGITHNHRINNNNNNNHHQHHEVSKPMTLTPHPFHSAYPIKSHSMGPANSTAPLRKHYPDSDSNDDYTDMDDDDDDDDHRNFIDKRDKSPVYNSPKSRKRGDDVGFCDISKSSQSKASSAPPANTRNVEDNNKYVIQHRHYQKYARNDHPNHNHSPHPNHSLHSNQCNSNSPRQEATNRATTITRSINSDAASCDCSLDMDATYQANFIEPVNLPDSKDPKYGARAEKFLRSTGLARRCLEKSPHHHHHHTEDGRATSMIPISNCRPSSTADNINAYRDNENEQKASLIAEDLSGDGGLCHQSNGTNRRFITRSHRTSPRERSNLNGGIPLSNPSNRSSVSHSPPLQRHSVTTTTGTISPNLSSNAETKSDFCPDSVTTDHVHTGRSEASKTGRPNRNLESEVIMTNSITAAPATSAPNTSLSSFTESSSNAAASSIVRNDLSESSDKRKDEDLLEQRNSSPNSSRLPQSPHHQQSPRHLTTPKKSPRPLSNCSPSSENEHANLGIVSSPTGRRMRSLGGAESAIPTRKLTPSMTVSMKQNLSDLHYTGITSISISPRKENYSPPSPKATKQHIQASELTTTANANSNATNGNTIGTKTINTASHPPNVRTISKRRPLSQADQPGLDESLFLEDVGEMRQRCSTMLSEESRSGSTFSNASKENNLDVSPFHTKQNFMEGTPQRHPVEDLDKSSKRKSNLNRSQNVESVQDADETIAVRRRRRRELGMARQLIPNDDPALREIISTQKNSEDPVNRKSIVKPKQRNDLAYHMENARRGLDLVNTPAGSITSPKERRRSQITNSKVIDSSATAINKTEEGKKGTTITRHTRRSDTLSQSGYETRKLRSNDVNRKLNERTKSDLADIIKIVEMVSDEKPSPPAAIIVSAATHDESRIEKCDNKRDTDVKRPGGHIINTNNGREVPSRADSSVSDYQRNHKLETFVAPSTLDKPKPALQRQCILKAHSVDREDNPRISPILRRKSTADEPSSSTSIPSGAASAHNHIVSILKKNSGESSSASSNASPVTFSANVLDTPTKHKRAGILKKRSSLDESRYYSRSHSPDERSILIKSARRNSLEETAGVGTASTQQHGILKQSSYDSCKSDGCSSANELHPHSILKKKDSTSTPCDGGVHISKHVSISQAVILAAAELCKDSASDTRRSEYDEGSPYTPANEEYDLRPILKVETTSSDDAMRQPKPILKKKSSSGDSDEPEIRPILKTSRKSSREEFDMGDDSRQTANEITVRPILKIESPTKRRSLGSNEIDGTSTNQLSLLQRRTRSLERAGEPNSSAGVSPVIDLAAALNAIGPQCTSSPLELVPKSTSVSVADRIRIMEKFLQTPSNSAVANSGDLQEDCESATNISWESPILAGAVSKIYQPSTVKRDFYRDRYKTQPITSEEKIMIFKSTPPTQDFVSRNDSAQPVATSTKSSAIPLQRIPAPTPSTTPRDNQRDAYATNQISSFKPSSPPPPKRPTQTKSSVSRPTSDIIEISSQDSDTTHRHTHFDDTSNNNDNEQSSASLAGSDSEINFDMSSGTIGIGGSNDGSENEQSSMRDDSAMETTPVSSARSKDEIDHKQLQSSIARKNSVRAKASMFAQLEEQSKTSNATDRLSPRRVLRRSSPPISFAETKNDGSNTSTNHQCINSDEEVEPSSLPLSERLRFFSTLSDSGRNSFHNRSSPPTQLNSFNGSVERSASAGGYTSYFTPHNYTNHNNSGHSASITPTPMECSLSGGSSCGENAIDFDKRNENNECIRTSASERRKSCNDFLMLKKSLSQSQVPNTLAIPQNNSLTEGLTPIAKRIKLKTIGKLMMPQTFLNCNDRNNTNNVRNNNNSSVNDDLDKPPVKKIGKIKSPFIEKQQQLQQQQQQQNAKFMKFDFRSSPSYGCVQAGGDGCVRDNNFPGEGRLNGDVGIQVDLGKENIAMSNNSSNAASEQREQKLPPVIEMRKKFTRNLSSCGFNSNGNLSAMRSHKTGSLNRHSYNGTSSSSSAVDERYAKYFGIPIKNTVVTTATTNTISTTNSVTTRNSLQERKTTSNVVIDDDINHIKIQMKTQRHIDFNEFMSDEDLSNRNQQPILAAVNKNVRLWNDTLLSKGIAAVKRRETGIKRNRPLTAVVTSTLNCYSPADGHEGLVTGINGTPSGRSTLRSGRSHTITHGIPFIQQVTEVKKFEDIMVTKEEFQLASKEFERIFLGVV